MMNEIPLNVFEQRPDEESSINSESLQSAYTLIRTNSNKRRQRIFYDFLRDHYKTLIYILFSIILLLLIILITLLVIPGVQNNNIKQDVSQNLSQNTENIEMIERLKKYIEEKTQEGEILHNKTVQENQRMKALINKLTQVTSTTTQEPQRTFCHRTRCDQDNYCNPSVIEYGVLRSYCCCCLPTYLTFKHFENETEISKVSITFEDSRSDPSKYSVNDLKFMEDLDNLQGDWEVVQTGYDIFMLKYTNIRLPQTPEPPEE